MRKMNGMIKPIYLVILAGLLLAWPSDLWAKSRSNISNYLTDEGKKYYKKGDTSSSIHNFSKALLVDPGNDTARDYLRKMGLENGIYNPQEPPVMRIALLGQQVRSYQDKVNDLSRINQEQAAVCDELGSDNDTLCRAVHTKQGEVEQLNTQLNLVEDQRTQDRAMDQKTIQHLEDDLNDHEQQLDSYGRVIRKHSRVIDQQGQYLNQKDEKINNLNKEVIFVKTDSLNDYADYQRRLLRQSSQYKDEILALQQKLSGIHTDDVQGRQDVQDEIAALEGLLHKKEQEVTDLKDQVLVKDLKLAKAEKRMIDEALGGEVTKFAYAYAPDQPVAGQAELMRKKDGHIAQLKEKLVSLMQRLDTLEKGSGASGATPEEISVLKQEIQSMKDQLAKKDVSLRQKDSDFELMQERLADAQEQISLVQDAASEKDTAIKELEQELIQMRDQCVR